MTVLGSEILTRDERWEQWLRETPPEITLEWHPFTAQILLGRFDREGEDGATLIWSDGPDEWAEHYSDLATAVCRLAALIRVADEQVFFKNGAQDFVRWSENFFTQTVGIPKPLSHLRGHFNGEMP